ncbi:hypothetical protein C8R43DRAFT_1002273 [Mycena crocata]|nr:hypothetical protein C8R43DRAFT_1002273 [Mycena crocata]
MPTYRAKYFAVPTVAGSTRRETLSNLECFWRDYALWFKERGYLLRPRYQPGWEPSWVKSGKEYWFAEDSIPNWAKGNLMDATRISDNTHVMMKISRVDQYPNEASIAEFLSSADLADDPRNHCVPIYEMLRVPNLSDIVILVMPLLYELQSPKFETIGEAVECFRQLFEGLQFIHEHNIAHRDCKYDSFMVESTPLFRIPPHPMDPSQRRDIAGPPRPVKTRTQLPVKYFIIDYNLSSRYTDAGPHLELVGWGGDKTVPEFQTEERCDPFAVDVYCLGNAVRRYFSQGWDDNDPGKSGFRFMQSLLKDMCRDDPKARPTMTDVVSRFEKIRLSLGELKLRSRVAPKNEFFPVSILRSIDHWVQQIVPIAKRISAVPKHG